MSAIALFLTLAGAFSFPGDLRQLTIRLTLLVGIGMIVAYATGRRGNFHFSAFLTVGLSLSGAVIGAVENPGAALAPVFIITGGLIGGLFLSTFLTFLIFAATVLLVSLAAPAIPSLTQNSYLTLLFFVALVAVIITIASLQRENRNAQIRTQASELADQQQRLEQALRAGEASNQELIRSVQNLHRLQTDTGLLSEWSEMMHACAAPADLHPVVQHFGALVFPRAQGRLYLYNPSRNDLESVLAWGNHQELARFPPEACWALRRGQLYRAGGARSHGPPCEHLIGEGVAVCAPLMAQSEILGLLTLSFPAASSESDLQAAQDLAGEASRRVAVALANLQLREVLRSQSLRDPMTNLFNRRVMEEMLLREIRRSERSQRPFSVLMLDLDHFKSFNDDHGHPAGDLLLQHIADLIVGRIRGSDVACRYGGEELVVILVEAGLEDAVRRADALRLEIGQQRVDYHGVLLRPVTCSIGVACFPHHGATPDLLIHAADTALYQAKGAGRNCVRHLPLPETAA